MLNKLHIIMKGCRSNKINSWVPKYALAKFPSFLLISLFFSFASHAQIKELKKMVEEAKTNTFDFDSVKAELASLIEKFNTDLTYFEQNKSAWIRRDELKNRTTLLKAMQYNYITADKDRGPYLQIEWDQFTPANVWMRNNIDKMLKELLDSSEYRKETCKSMYPPCSRVYYNGLGEKAYSINDEYNGSLYFILFRHGINKELYRQKQGVDSLSGLFLVESLVNEIEKAPNKDSFTLVAKYKAENCTGKPFTQENQYIFSDCAKANKINKDNSGQKVRYRIFVVGQNIKSCTALRYNSATPALDFKNSLSSITTAEKAATLSKYNIGVFSNMLEEDGNSYMGLAIIAEKVIDPAYVLIFKKL